MSDSKSYVVTDALGSTKIYADVKGWRSFVFAMEATGRKVREATMAEIRASRPKAMHGALHLVAVAGTPASTASPVEATASAILSAARIERSAPKPSARLAALSRAVDIIRGAA